VCSCWRYGLALTTQSSFLSSLSFPWFSRVHVGFIFLFKKIDFFKFHHPISCWLRIEFDIFFVIYFLYDYYGLITLIVDLVGYLKLVRVNIIFHYLSISKIISCIIPVFQYLKRYRPIYIIFWINDIYKKIVLENTLIISRHFGFAPEKKWYNPQQYTSYWSSKCYGHNIFPQLIKCKRIACTDISCMSPKTSFYGKRKFHSLQDFELELCKCNFEPLVYLYLTSLVYQSIKLPNYKKV